MTDPCTGNRLGQEVEWHDVQALLRWGLQPFRHSCVRVLTFDAAASAARLRTWLGQQLGSITAARDDLYPGGNDVGKATNIVIPASGLARFGFKDDDVAWFPREFVAGMSSPRAAKVLGDGGNSHPSTWQWGHGAARADALLLLFSNDPGLLSSSVRAAQVALQGLGWTDAIRTWQEDYAPFGFRDGISNPAIRGAKSGRTTWADGATVEPGEFVFGYADERSLARCRQASPNTARPCPCRS